jgi:hypothetical protein
MMAGAALAVLLTGCAGDDSTQTGPQVATFKCAPDTRTVDQILEAVNEHDDDDYKNATQFALAVPPGTPVQVIAHTIGASPKVRVVVLDGPFKGERCWYPRNIDGILGS